LRKQFGSFVAVDGVDLSVAHGDTVALLGPSGCGKSTILNMLVGLHPPTSGDILVDGKSVLGIPPQERKIGLVFQDYAVFTHMSVRKNLAFGLEIRGRPRAEIDRAVGEVAALVGLTEVLEESPRILGSSQLQRVGIGRTLIMKPALLLLDEPLSNLETELRTAMRQQLRLLQQEYGQTLIYVTHDQIEALSLANKIAVIAEGKIRQFDLADRTYNEPAHTFVASFLGTPPMNLVPVRSSPNERDVVVTPGGAAIRLPRGSFPDEAIEGRRMVFGVRPESLEVATGDSSMIEARVALVEPLGPEKIATFVVEDWEFKALFVAKAALVEGEVMSLTARSSRICLFDAESGVRLNPRSMGRLEI
ncbi:MAG: ABC transporter ATP-binding protein, partial [Roseovarius sp.]|nr:ABC transporter ATP-binding protein [Roseovarius sp.]